jgi:AraC-like DNA-binding protein
MRATASMCQQKNFGIFAFTYSEDSTLTALAESPNLWLPVPVSVGSDGDTVPCRSVRRIAMPGRNDPLKVKAEAQYLGLSLPIEAVQDFADTVMDLRARSLGDRLRVFDTDNPLHMAVAQCVVEMVAIDAVDPTFFPDDTRVQAHLEPIMGLVISGGRSDEGRQRLPSPRDVKRVVDFIESSLPDPITLAALAQVANVPIRTLSAHFNLKFGLSPMMYVAQRRLDRAFVALHSGAVSTVTEAALNSGLSHFGRFSVAYRKRFGEHPSQTLRRSQRRTT